MRHRPNNVKPFRELMTCLKNRLIQTCKPIDHEHAERLWCPAAWVDFLLWDLRTATETKAGYKEVDIEAVRNYADQNKRFTTMYERRDMEIPEDWVEQSINTLSANEWFIPSHRGGKTIRVKPTRKLIRYFLSIEDLERAYDPYAINGMNSNEALLRRIERLERRIDTVGEMVGLPRDSIG